MRRQASIESIQGRILPFTRGPRGFSRRGLVIAPPACLHPRDRHHGSFSTPHAGAWLPTSSRRMPTSRCRQRVRAAVRGRRCFSTTRGSKSLGRHPADRSGGSPRSVWIRTRSPPSHSGFTQAMVTMASRPANRLSPVLPRPLTRPRDVTQPEGITVAVRVPSRGLPQLSRRGPGVDPPLTVHLVPNA